MSTHPLNKKVGENIENCRLQSKKNIKQMASLLDLTETGYRNIERGITEAGATKLFKIAEILNVPVSQLLNLTDENSGYKNDTHSQVIKTDDSFYRLCIDQYKAENQFLKRQLAIMEDLLSKAISA